MHKRRLIFVIISLILALVMVFLFVKPWSNKGSGSRKVALRDASRADRIILVDSYHSTELVKTGASWLVFGAEPVNPQSVNNLLIAAGRLEIASILGNKERVASDSLLGDTRFVTFLEGDKVLLSYELSSYSGRFLLTLPNSETAYYVRVPGYSGLDLSRVFSASPDHYRDRLLMDLRPSEISVLEIELASGESFRFIQDKGGDISCEALNKQTVLPQGEPDELAIQLLFSYFTSVRYEQVAGIAADSLREFFPVEQKMARIGIESFSGEHHSLQVFSYLETPASDPHQFRALVLYNDRQEALFVNYIYLDVLMRGLSHYFGEK
jgi:hypothetical protein